MTSTIRKSVPMILLSLLVLACAHKEPRPERLNLPPGTVVEDPVDRVFIGGYIRDWQIASDRSIRMEFNRQRQFLVELAPPCPSIFRAATTLRLIPGEGGYMSTFDRVQMGDTICRIQTIRPLSRGENE